MPLLSLRSCRVPPPILGPTEIASRQPTPQSAALDFAGLLSHPIRNTVTNDSIASSAQGLLWGAFARIRSAILVNAQPDWAFSERIVLRNARTAGRELQMQGQTKAAPASPDRVRCGIRAGFAKTESSFSAGLFRARVPNGLPGMRDRRRLLADRLAAHSALGKGTRFLTELPPMALSLGEHTTTAFAGR